MNIAYEFSKVKDSFLKVKNDMYALTNKINENYEDFIKKHDGVAKEVQVLSNVIRDNLELFRKQDREGTVSEKEVMQLRSEVSELKELISHSQQANFKIATILEDVKENKLGVSKLKEQLHSSELEVYLLKERMLEKNIELKQMKEISSHMLKVIEELSSLEIELLNRGKVV